MYGRPPGAGRGDFQAAREFEETVGEWLGSHKIGSLDSTTKMDWWVPGVYIDVKEKRQPLSDRFTKHWPSVPGEDLFVLDELSWRRSMGYGYSAYFLLRDVPMGRVFLARADELGCAERVRLDRETSADRKKGKWLIHLPSFRQLNDPEKDLLPTVLSDQADTPWKLSPCLSQTDIETV